MPLINFKILLKLEWTKRCVLSAAGSDNADVNSNDIISYYQRHKYICLCNNFISKTS